MEKTLPLLIIITPSLLGAIYPGMITSKGVLAGLLVDENNTLYAFSCYHLWGAKGYVVINGYIRARITYHHSPFEPDNYRVAEYSIAEITRLNQTPQSLIGNYRSPIRGETVYAITGNKTTTCKVIASEVPVIAVRYGDKLVEFHDTFLVQCSSPAHSGSPLISWDGKYLGYVFAGYPQRHIYYAIKATKLLEDIDKRFNKTFTLLYNPALPPLSQNLAKLDKPLVLAKPTIIGVIIVQTMPGTTMIWIDSPNQNPITVNNLAIIHLAPGKHILYIEMQSNQTRARTIIKLTARETIRIPSAKILPPL